jgi:hypothetical protein
VCYTTNAPRFSFNNCFGHERIEFLLRDAPSDQSIFILDFNFNCFAKEI